MRTSPPPGKKRVADWLGLKVRTVREMSNHNLKIAAGTLCTVTGAGSGLRLSTEGCPTCGVGIYIHGVSPSSVKVVYE